MFIASGGLVSVKIYDPDLKGVNTPDFFIVVLKYLLSKIWYPNPFRWGRLVEGKSCQVANTFLMIQSLAGRNKMTRDGWHDSRFEIRFQAYSWVWLKTVLTLLRRLKRLFYFAYLNINLTLDIIPVQLNAIFHLWHFSYFWFKHRFSVLVRTA